MHKKHLLITGGSGYLGSNLVKKLVTLNYKITVIIRESSNLYRIQNLGSNISFVYASEIEGFLKNEKIDGIIHTAACYGRKSETTEEIIESNLLFPLKILKLATEHEVSFFINTDTSLPKNLNQYSLSKSHFKDWLLQTSNNVKIVNIIPEYFYGPNDDNSKFITGVIKKFINNEKFIDFTSGKQERDFIYIDDIVDAYCCVLNNINEISNYLDIPVGTSNTITLKDLVLLIKEQINNHTTQLNFGSIADRKGDVMHSKANISFLKSLGWNPKTNIKDGIQKTIKYQQL